MTPNCNAYHVTAGGESWLVSIDGKSTYRSFKTKERSVSYATAEAKMNTPSHVTIHNKDGTLKERTYVNDPFPPRG